MFGAVLIVYLIFMLISLAIPVAAYIMTGIGLSRMARACNLRSPWLAWVPIGDLYTIGSIAEIGASRGGKKSMPYRKILPGITGGFLALFLAFIILMVGFILSNPDSFESDYSDESADIGYVSYSPDDSYDYVYEVYIEDTDAALALLFLLMMFFYLLIFVVAIVLTIFEYLALWHVFHLFDESNAVLYLVLSIFINVALPIIYLILGRKIPNLPSPEPVNVQPVTVGAYAPVAPAVSAPVAPVQPAIEAPAEQTSDVPPSDTQI